MMNVPYTYVEQYKINNAMNFDQGYINLEELLNRSFKQICNSHINIILNSIDNSKQVIERLKYDLNGYTTDDVQINNYGIDNNNLVEVIYSGDDSMVANVNYSAEKNELLDMLACCDFNEIGVYKTGVSFDDNHLLNNSSSLVLNSEVEDYILKERNI